MVKPIVIFLFAAAAYAAYASEHNDSTTSQELKEIVVEGARIIHKPGHDVLILSDRNRKFGVNALEAISSMNYFKTSIGETELYTHDNKKILITINGVPAKGTELCSYSAEIIKNVEYYSPTPAEYMELTDGPVINVITRKPQERMLSGYFNLRNAVSIISGNNFGTLTYADSLNQVKAIYTMGYNNTDKSEKTARYAYSPTRISDYREKGKLINTYHDIDLSYQRSQGAHLLNIALSGSYGHSKEHYEGPAQIINGDDSADGDLFSVNTAAEKRAAASIYYRLNLSRRKILAFNIANTIGESNSEASRHRNIAPPFDNLNYDVASNTDNNSYAMNAAAVFSMPVKHGGFDASLRYAYTRLRQTSMGLKSTPEMHRAGASARYAWMLNGFSVVPSAGMSAVRESRTSVAPTFNLQASWNPSKGLLNGWAAKLSYNLRHCSSAMGNLANSISYKDNHFISAGNPDLRPFQLHNGGLSIEYFSPDGKNYFSASANQSYADGIFKPVLSRKGDMIILHYDNIRYSYSCSYVINAAWYVLPWLELSAYADYNYSRESMAGRIASCDQWRVGGSFYASVGKFEVSASFNPPIKSVEGDLFIHKSAQSLGRIRYKHKQLSVSCEYRCFAQNEYTIGRLGEFEYKEDLTLKSHKYYVGVSITYSFSKGKQMSHDERMLYEGSYDTGLGDFNSVVKP